MVLRVYLIFWLKKRFMDNVLEEWFFSCVIEKENSPASFSLCTKKLIPLLFDYAFIFFLRSWPNQFCLFYTHTFDSCHFYLPVTTSKCGVHRRETGCRHWARLFRETSCAAALYFWRNFEIIRIIIIAWLFFPSCTVFQGKTVDGGNSV